MAEVKFTKKPQSIGGNPIKGDISDIIGAAADKYGLDRSTMERMAQIESAGNPNAKNKRSSAGGLYQFIDSTARQYRLEDRYDPLQASDAGARLMRDNINGLRKALGREPTAGEAYLAHQQGLKGAIALLKNPQSSAVDALSTVMSKKKAEAAVRLNGDPTGRLTAGQFAGLWKGKLDNVSFKVDDKFGQLPTSSVLSNYAPMGMSFSATPGLSALRAAYDDVRTAPPAMGASGFFGNPTIGAMVAPGIAPRATPSPTFTQGDKVFADKPNMGGSGILGAASAIGNFASGIYNRAQDAAPRPGGTVPNYSATTPRGATPPGNFRQSPAISGSGSFTPTNVPSLGGVMADHVTYNHDAGPMVVGYTPAGPNAWDGSNARYATPENSLFREGDDYSRPYVSTPSLSTFSMPTPQGGDALSRLRATVSSPSMATRGGMANPQAAPVGAVQSSPLAAPQAPTPARADPLSRLRSMAEPQGDMRANPFDMSSGTYAMGANPVLNKMDKDAAKPGLKSVATGGQASQTAASKSVNQYGKAGLGDSAAIKAKLPNLTQNPYSTQYATKPAAPNYAMKSLGPAQPKATPKAAPKAAPTMQTATGLAKAVQAPGKVATATGSILGTLGSKVGAGIMGGLSSLGTLQPAGQQALIAQALKAKAMVDAAAQPAPTPAPVYQAPQPVYTPRRVVAPVQAATPVASLASLTGRNDTTAGLFNGPQRISTAPSGGGLYSYGQDINGVRQVFNTATPSNAFGAMGYGNPFSGFSGLGAMFGGGGPSKSSDSKGQSKSDGGGWGAGSSRPTGGGAGGGLKSGPYGK